MIEATDSQRRIKNGLDVNNEVKYIAYLIKAPHAPVIYDAWVCGGAIVHPEFIITSAACIEDVHFMYAIAGYKNYPETDAIVMGWGHKDKWRVPGDTVDYNQPTLKYSSVLLQKKEDCKEYYRNIDGMDEVIDKYMLCATKAGGIDAKGNLFVRSPPLADGCANNYVRIGGLCQSPEVLKHLTILTDEETEKPITPPPPPNNYQNPSHEPTPAEALVPDVTYKSYSASDSVNVKGTDDDTTITFDDIAFRFRRTQMGTTLTNFSRRVGICQNDHGGPLVTWVGKHEVLIGVASAFRVSQHYECIGPYLFTSTQCNGAFLNCIINNMTSTRRDPVCDLPPGERGYEIVERRISWKHHPDGPAANEPPEDFFERPQNPINNY
ncbi:uncharacterized protein LOC126376947 [Pectinophora gossypiella]|uniref:uncharacterized protein LOC126376947 n=1 Tax=Pectinophora gossypiella TaxID=13191 RepID=UPI00214F1206|nr:uncharacterized protein LOC126376947 [Pectinophora gossypiella]